MRKINIYSEVGNKIKEVRKSKNYSQAFLGDIVDLDNTTISQIESGKYRLSIGVLNGLALALDKPLHFFTTKNSEVVLPKEALSIKKGDLSLEDIVELNKKRGKNKFVHLVITGNIGAGKSAVMELFADHFNGDIFLENEANNPFLSKYYKNMKKYAFRSQLYFITESLKRHTKIEKSTKSVIQDRSIHEQCKIFAPALFELNILEEKEFKIIDTLYESVKDLYTPPNLVVYLRANVTTLFKRIMGRGRIYEAKISKKYLEVLNNKHDEWIRNFDLCKTITIETDNLELLNIPSHRRNFISRVDDAL